MGDWKVAVSGKNDGSTWSRPPGLQRRHSCRRRQALELWEALPMKPALLVAAEAQEFAGLLRHCRETERLEWPLGYAGRAKLDSRKLVMVANGPGPSLAARAFDEAIEREDFGSVVSIGFCGALDPEFTEGEIFAASRVEIAGGAAWPACLPSSPKPFRCGSLISVGQVIQTVEEKRRLRSTGASVVEMEAAALASCAAREGLPFYCIRVVMDRADEGFALDLNRLRDPEGRFSRVRILREALAHPLEVAPELIRLERRCRKAARSLGEFLADCQF
jgi:adenosylhomocysteine nucleosidase